LFDCIVWDASIISYSAYQTLSINKMNESAVEE
jgi:hypothetical protein